MSSLANGFSYLKKYLLKGINLETADSKGLKTLALCWVYRKRAFSVSGSFRKALTDLITDLHNSNKKTVQTTLSGDIIPEEKYYLLGFVPATTLEPYLNSWFSKLIPKQISAINAYLEKSSYD